MGAMSDPLSIQVAIDGIGVKAATDLGEGAAVTYQRLRQLEQDDMKTSESAALAAYAAPASAPVISPPSAFGPTEAPASSIAAVKKTKAVSLIEAKLGAEIMEAWATSVHKAGKQRYDLENSPIYRAQEAYWREFRNGEHLAAYSTAHSITATFVIGATFTGYVGPTGRSETHISYNTTVEAMQQITPSIPGPGDMRAELGLIGATLAYGAVFQAAWITAAESGKMQLKGEKLNLQFAANYADRMIAHCKDPAYDTLLTTLIAQHLEGATPLPPEKMQEMVAMVKLGMLMSAAALFYQAETGGQTGIEVFALLDPKAPPLEPNNPRAKLVDQIRQLLSVVRDQGVRQTVLEKIMAFLDDNKSVKSLTDPVTILLGIFGGDAALSGGGGMTVAA